MKLYTLNATPNRSRAEQFNWDTEALGQVEMDVMNKDAIENYPQTVAKLLSTHGLDGFTIYKVDGYWQGTPEVSFKIEIATDNKNDIYIIATELRNMFNQDSVMLTLPDNSVEFI